MTGDPVSGTSKGAFTNPGVVHPVTKARSHGGPEYLSEVVKR
jgi:hypothetical protein